MLVRFERNLLDISLSHVQVVVGNEPITFGQKRNMFSCSSSWLALRAEPFPFSVTTFFGAGEGVSGSAAACLRVLTPDMMAYQCMRIHSFQAPQNALGVWLGRTLSECRYEVTSGTGVCVE